MISVAYPVELGIRLRALVYPVQKLYDDEFVIEPDARAALEEFVVSCDLLSAFSCEYGLCIQVFREGE